MSDNVIDTVKRQSVIAIAQADSRLKAVELRREAAALEVLWAKTSKDSDEDWPQFAAECGLAPGNIEQPEGDGHREVVAGFGSAGVVFYRLDVPAGTETETESIVKLQAESRLPLPAEQMEIAWRAGQTRNGQMAVTMAAARKEILRDFVENVRAVTPARIMLDCEGIVKAWQTFFRGDQGVAVIVSAAARNSHVCLAEDGRLSNAVVLDMGTDDFSGAAQAAGQTEATERFVRDMKSVLELFGYADPAELPLVVLSDGSDAIQGMVTALESGGLNARAVLPQVAELTANSELDAEGIYEYRVPIGIGLVAFEPRADDLNIFEHLYNPLKEQEKKPWLYSPKAAAAIAVVMLAVLALVSYAADVAMPGAMDRRLKAALSDSDMKELMNRQSLRKTIAAERPDILQIIEIVNESGQGGITLDGVHFKKGTAASITGEAPGNAQLYKFEETLNNNKYISDAKIQNPSMDAKSKKIRFTITFKYKNFSEKKTRTPR